MITKISHITVLVRDQDEALAWYRDKLGFEKRVDSLFGPDLRRLTVAPKGQSGPQIVLQKPLPDLHGPGWERLMERVGRGTELVLESDDCWKDYQELTARGVRFAGAPEESAWGIQALFADLYGNPIVLLEPRAFA